MFSALKPRLAPTSVLPRQSVFRRSMTSNLHRPENWKEAAPASLPGPTFAAQSSLPKLPVPELSDTLAKLKESLRPIAQDEKEYERVVKRIDEFAVKHGPALQERLVQRAKERDHWLEEWWDDLGYLGYRDSVVINVSYYYGFDDHPARYPQRSTHRAASLVRATMLFRQQFKLGQVKPEATRDGPICMDTWRWMFDCCRIPGQEKLDWSASYAKPGDDGTSGHIVVFRKGRVYKLDPWQNGRLLSVAEIEEQLQYIKDSTTKEYPQVGVLTSANRDTWAKNYAALQKYSSNVNIIETIQSAAFVLSLDDIEPNNFIEHSTALWHGGYSKKGHEHPLLGLRNRWVDKPVQFIVYDNGKAGIMGEHSVMDGTPTVALCDAVLDMIASANFDAGAPAGTPPAPPQPLDWTLDAGLVREVQAAGAAIGALIDDHVVGLVRTPYGKAATKQFGVGPDSWAQMVVQLAYARLLARSGAQRTGATYEAATTRRFYKGRTEAIRVVTSESDAWVKSMDDGNLDDPRRRELFQAAVKKHVKLAKEAGNGLGIDRHLLGLKLLHPKTEPVPELFNDDVLKRSSNWVLSTSAIFSKHFGPYGWGEVVPDGFGVAYMTGFDNYLQYTVTSRKDMPNAAFCKELERAASDLFQLHARTAPALKANL